MLRRMLVLTAALLACSATFTAAAAPVTTTDLVKQAMDQERAISRCNAFIETQHAMEFDGSGAIKSGQELFVVRRVVSHLLERRYEDWVAGKSVTSRAGPDPETALA